MNDTPNIPTNETEPTGPSNETEPTGPMHTLGYGTSSTLAIADIPAKSQVALMQRGLNHVLSNEVSSKVHSWATKEAIVPEGTTEAAAKPLIKAWKDGHTDAIAAKTAEFVQAALDSIMAGTLGVRAAAAPKLSTLDQIKRRIAKAEIVAVLGKLSVAVPKKDEAILLPNGQTRTLEQMIDNRLAHAEFGAAIAKKADKELADLQKKQAAAVAAAETTDIDSL